MSQAHIRFSSDILSRLGEELNPSPDQGILELIKNSYDANAHKCQIEIFNAHEAGGNIRIIDDGDGMTAENIRDDWLVLGRSRKSKSAPTRLGRIPAGSKGLGRLAALRMGHSTILTTQPMSSNTDEYSLSIDWSKFENIDLVDDVNLNIVKRQRKTPKPGSEILINNLRTKISRMDVKRLARALLLLADPFGDDPGGFEPILIAPEFSDLETLVRNRYFQDADYHLIALINKEGFSSASVVDWKGEALFSADHGDLTAHRNKRPFDCPPTSFDFWAYILNSTAFNTRQSTLKEVRDWLTNFGGVHLYENGLRVSPYGNPGNDWLDINLRRAQSPEERPSTNTSIGRVSVIDSEGLLLQKTDRSGFIENDNFSEIRDFAQASLEWMAKRRLEIAEQRRAKERASAPKRTKRTKVNLEQAIDKVPPRSRTQIMQALDAYDRSHEREVNQLKREVQLYRTLSTAGITAATFAHESRGNPLKVITQALNAIHRRAKKLLPDDFEKSFSGPIEKIRNSTSALEVLSSATLRLIDHGKRRTGRVEIHKVIKDVLDTFSPFLKGRDVKIKTELSPGNPFLRASEAAVESIITNLLNNSLTALEDAHGKSRVILMRTSVSETVAEIQVMDNGPGIENISIKDIWLPGQTTRPNGTGLGLAIVHDAVKDLGGQVSAIDNGELGGAEFHVELPIIGI